MDGTGSPERDRVDAQLGLAREAINTNRAQIGAGAVLTADQLIAITAMLVRLHCTEALVRQIRDLDDDVWAVKNAILEANADLITTINGGLSMHIDNLPESKKGFLRD